MSKTIYELIEDIDRRTKRLDNKIDTIAEKDDLIDRLRTRLACANGLMEMMTEILVNSKLRSNNPKLLAVADRLDAIYYDQYLKLAPL